MLLQSYEFNPVFVPFLPLAVLRTGNSLFCWCLRAKGRRKPLTSQRLNSTGAGCWEPAGAWKVHHPVWGCWVLQKLHSTPSPKYQCQNTEGKLSNERIISVSLLHNTSGYLNSLQTKLSAICCCKPLDTGKNEVGKVLQMDCDLIEASEDRALWTLNRCNSNYILRADTLMSKTQKLFSSLRCLCFWVRLHWFGKGSMCLWLNIEVRCYNLWDNPSQDPNNV